MVSVILPVYNQEKYLDRSIPSVMKQSYTDLEILAVDDGSTDRSNEILKEYAQSDTRIRIIEKKNGGLVSAVSAGIRKARGEYICFLDPDDELGETFVETFLNSIGDADFIAMGFYSVRENKQKVEIKLAYDMQYEYVKKYQNGVVIDPELKTKAFRFYFSRCNKMFRSRVVKSIVDCYESVADISYGEDTIFTYLILGVAEKAVTKIESNSYIYYTNSNTSMMKNTDVDQYYRRAGTTYKYFKSMLNKDGYDNKQAAGLFVFQMMGLIRRLIEDENNKVSFVELFNRLKRNRVFCRNIDLCKRYSVFNKVFCLLWKLNINGSVLYHECSLVLKASELVKKRNV